MSDRTRKFEEVLELKDGTFIDCKFEEGDPAILSEQSMKKFRPSLGAVEVDRSDVGQMVLTFGQPTNMMSKNVHRDKEKENNIKSIDFYRT